MRLEGKVIVVTGATGIAGASARFLGEEGASVFVVSIDEAESRELAESLDSADWHAADLSDESETRRAFEAAVARFGTVDGLLAVAGGSGRRAGDGPLHEITVKGWSKTLEMNLTTSFLSARETVRAIRESGAGGSVVLVTSVLALHPSNLFATHAYAAAKGAQISLVKAAAAFYADDGIRFNAVAPGLTRTPMAARALGDADTMEYLQSKQRLAPNALDPHDIATAAAYLLSDEAKAVTGQVLSVDGGWSVSEGR